MLESLLGAGVKLLGGFLGKSSQDDANRIAQENAERNIALQREFAQNAIQWKVADAQKAGIHPIYALGGSTTSFSPVSVGVSGANPLASALGDMGQDVSRAASALRSDRSNVLVSAQSQALSVLGLERAKLENDLLRAQIIKISQPGTPPPPATLGTGGTAGGFEIPEEGKIKDERKPLMLGGRRVYTDPHTSPMKAWEDQIGDEGPLSWLAQMAQGDTILRQNLGGPHTWPGQAARWFYNTIKQEVRDEVANARRFGKRYLPSVVGP